MKLYLQILRENSSLLLLSLISIPLGYLVGSIDALFGRVLLAITSFRSAHPWQLVPFLPLCGVLIAFLYLRLGKGTEKGMGLVFDACLGHTDSIPLRLVPFVISSTWMTHLFGGSTGREGVAGRMDYSALLPSLCAALTASTVSGLLGLEKFTCILSQQPILSETLLWKLVFLGLVFGAVGGSFAFFLK